VIPYFELRRIPIGGDVSLAAFGLLVALGVFAGVLFAQSRARALGVPEHELTAAIAWALVPGFLLAHAVTLVFYRGESARPRARRS
jgi:prolipoprotein diacylglyceryltransferase